MGRKAKFDETKKVKKGPGRKARKQPDPVFKKELCKYISHVFYFIECTFLYDFHGFLSIKLH